jgi:hypothetical protein
MSQSIGSIAVDLSVNSASFLSGMDRATASAKSSLKGIGESVSGLGEAIGSALEPLGGEIGGQLSSLFNGIGSSVSAVASKMGAMSGTLGVAAAAAGGLAAAGIAAAGALAGLALSGGEMAENLSLMSQRTGISIRNLQTLQAAGASVGVPLEDLSAGFRKFSQALADTGKGSAAQQAVLRELGVTSHDTFTALSQLADAFSRMEDGPTKAALAAQLFGKSSASWIPILDRGRDGLQEFSDLVEQFGPVIDKNAVQGMEAWKKSTTELSLAWDSFKGSLAGSVGVLATVVDKMAQLTKGLGDTFTVLSKHPLDALEGLVTGDIGVALRNVVPTDLPQQQNDSKQQAAIATQDALIAKYKQKYEILKAGGQAEYQLAQQELSIQGAVEAGNFQQAAALQAQIPALKEAVVQEQKRLAAAKEMLDVLTRQSAGLIHPTNTTRAFPKIEAPEIKTTADQFNEVAESLQKLTNVGGVTTAVLDMGKSAIADFYKEWDHDNKNTIDVINQRFTGQLDHFKGLLALQAISQQDFNDVSKDLETDRIAQIQKIQAKSGTDFATSFASAFADIADQADKFAKNLADSIGGAVNDLSGQLASLATTGRSNFKQVGQSLEGNVVKSGASALFGVATKHIAGAFGVQFGKPDGTSNNPIYTRSADGIADHVKGLGHKLNLGSIGKDISGAFKNIGSSLGSIFGKIGGGVGSIFGSIFGGFRAGGGDVTPGHAYVVGERQPEMFIPRGAGRIAPSVSPTAFAASGHRPINVSAHFHGVQDADTFKASQNQIMNHLANQVSRAVGRR